MHRTVFCFGTMKEVIYFDGEVARYMKGVNRLRNRGRFGPAVRNRAGRMLSSLSLLDGLAYFVTAMMPATSKEMGENLAEVSNRWISECGISSIMKIEGEMYWLLLRCLQMTPCVNC